ncbi:MAG: hypothetical protein IKC56_01415 [Clostridia bacterium]|nr:hypothetical protein [Clostridia bacterium]
MKISAFQYIFFVILLSIVFAILDAILIFYYGFSRQFLIFLYVLIGCVPLCGLISLFVGMYPAIMLNNDSKTIKTLSIPDERYKIKKSLYNTTATISFNEINSCEIENKKLIIKLRYGHEKILFLNFFSKSQIAKIKKQIDEIIKNTYWH